MPPRSGGRAAGPPGHDPGQRLGRLHRRLVVDEQRHGPVAAAELARSNQSFRITNDTFGVDPDEVEALIDRGILVVSGRRVLPAELRNARILRLELPQGRFERRIPLPPGR